MLGGESIDLGAHSGQFFFGDLLVYFLRNRVNLFSQRLIIFHHKLNAERLVGKAHIHNAGGMAFRGRQINQAALAQHIDPAAVFQHKFFHKGPNNPARFRNALQSHQIQFDVKMTGIGHNSPIFHDQKVFFADDINIAGKRAEKITDPRGFADRHHAKSVHNRLKGRQRIDLSDNYMRPHSTGAHGHTPAAPSITADHKIATGQQTIGCPNNAVNRALPGAVSIIKKMFCARVINSNDRILQHPVGSHASESNNAGCGFFGPPPNFGQQLGALRMQGRHQIGTIVHGELGLGVQHGIYVPVVGSVVFAFNSEYRNLVMFNKSGGHVILGAERIRCTQRNRGPSGFQSLHQGGGFSGHVQACSQAYAFEWFFFFKALPDPV